MEEREKKKRSESEGFGVGDRTSIKHLQEIVMVQKPAKEYPLHQKKVKKTIDQCLL